MRRIFKTNTQRFLFFLVVGIFGCVAFTSRADTDVRQTRWLDSGWRFQKGDPAKAPLPGYDDSNWTPVAIPHCWGWRQAQQGKMYYRGPGWYRRELVIKPQSDKRYFLRFEAASLVTDVYLNGQFIGEHRGGFGAFCFEITKDLSASDTNLLAVRVDNSPQPDIAPVSGDFPVYGGIYRPVHLIVTAQENFTLTDHASPGVEWLQTHVATNEAVLDVNTEISNGTKKQQPLTLVARIVDAEGREVAATQRDIVLEPIFTEPFHQRIRLANPHLWDGRKDPYLYRSIVELRSGTNIVDSVEQPLGLRWYHVDPDKGFFLNGHPYDLHGVSRHQDRPNKGWAISDADMDEDIALLKEIGATVVRCAHYQHSGYFYSQCDKAGILVWAEIPQVNYIRDTAAFEDTSINQLRDLIRQNINHPSIFVWSLFNEVGNGGTQDPHRELMDLNIVAHGEDPTRPTIGATCIPSLPQMNKIPDLLGWNIYPGWYRNWGPLSNFSKVAKYRYTSRRGGFCVSEYGAGANVTQHEENPKWPEAGGQWHPEEYQAIYHEYAWKELKTKPYIWARIVWNLADFVSYYRHEGGMVGRNDKGLVTFDRKIKKDAFYFYKANWNQTPMIYITSRRFTERTNAVTDVKVYSNAATAELLVNGHSQGFRANDGNAVFIWKHIVLRPGKNTIEARAHSGSQQLTDNCSWNLESAR